MPELPLTAHRLAGRAAHHLLAACGWLTSPRTPDDYLALVDPLLGARHPAGRVTAIRPETADATSLVITPGRGWHGHRAGQYLPVGVEIDGVQHWRTYSLTSPPGRPGGPVAITVKAADSGTVSPYLAHRIRRGALLRLGPAQGAFTLPDPLPRRMLMVTAGSGITPVMGILRTLMARRATGPRPDVLLVHSAPGPADVIFRTELRLAQSELSWFRLHEHHTRHGPARAGRLTLDHLTRLCPDWRERETWACGPAALLDALEDHWARAGTPDRLHVERFALAPVPRADTSHAAADGSSGGRVRFLRSGIEADADPARPLLEVGEAAGAVLPYGCRRGICFGCLVPLARGRVRDLRSGHTHDEPGQLIQTCVSAAAGSVALDV
ncbi:ferredoxin reductase [Streptomyces purpurogeneiscleroticus]|uniref:ferredoxin reductase n=1 Tax=Streptomyces purpurogeneiscleroticus TaxID=68259 RepID=UPI001CBA8009|nr:ferredoxin reductase [Streptomyces purpurogeneiscleroticus]MBZ4017741.1 stearoyl-CoA 9-desaturase [Streptomyces purpurogeneiscleroticus]